MPSDIFSVSPPTEVVEIDVSAADQAFDPPLRAISIGTAGDLEVVMPHSAAFVIPANCLAAGVQHAMIIKEIKNAGTTASELVGWR